jgi:putative endonuclease
MSWYLYIAQAKTGRYYVGITTKPKRRIEDHNNGRGCRMAVNQGPFVLVYTSPSLPNQSVARKLEIQVKSWPRVKKQKLIDGQLHNLFEGLQ